MDEENRKEIGKRIRQARGKSGLTQEEVVSKMELNKVSVSTLSLIENGRRKAHPKTLQTIADALGISVQELRPELAQPAQIAGSQPVSPQELVESKQVSLQEIRELLLRYEPLKGVEQAVDSICEQIELWSFSIFRGYTRSQGTLDACDKKVES